MLVSFTKACGVNLTGSQCWSSALLAQAASSPEHHRIAVFGIVHGERTPDGDLLNWQVLCGCLNAEPQG